jgi:hypothetical protein
VKTITPYQAEAIELVLRHTILTADLAHRFLCPWNTCDAARKLLDALRGKAWLRHFQPVKHFTYYVLTPQATSAVGVHRRHSRELGFTALLRAYGAAAFCAGTGTERLSPTEFADKYPRLCARGVSRRGYIERDGKLGFIQVDVAQKPDAVVGKLMRIARQRAKIRDFAPLLHERRFFIVVVTPCESKRDSLEREIRKNFRWQVPWELRVVPELLQLLTWLEVR